MSDEEKKDFFNQAVNTAYSQGYNVGYDKGYAEGYDAAIEGENRRSYARNLDRWGNVPTEELRVEIGGLADCIDDLTGRLKRIEAVVFYGGKE